MANSINFTRVCPQCRKPYVITCRADQWGYAYGKVLLCSYHCMRAYERKRAGKRVTA